MTLVATCLVIPRCMHLSGTVTEIWRLKDNAVTTLTFWGHVTSSITWPFDSWGSTSYGWSIVTMGLSSTVMEIWPFEVLPRRLFQDQRSVVGRSVLNITKSTKSNSVLYCRWYSNNNKQHAYLAMEQRWQNVRPQIVHWQRQCSHKSFSHQEQRDGDWSAGLSWRWQLQQDACCLLITGSKKHFKDHATSTAYCAIFVSKTVLLAWSKTSFIISNAESYFYTTYLHDTLYCRS